MREADAWGLRSAGVRVAAFAGSCEGKISLVAAPWILGLALLACFLGNTGVMPARRIEAQNAADSAAWSLAAHQARGMNTITAINHIMGDLTAVVVALEAIGGHELDENYGSRPVSTRESTELVKEIRRLTTDRTPSGTVPAGYGNLLGGKVQVFTRVDKALINAVGKRMTETKEYAGGAIYDGRMVLKRHMTVILQNKEVISEVVDILSHIPFPLFQALDPLSIPVHVGLDAVILMIGKEWLVLSAWETACASAKPIKDSARMLMLPALSMVGDHLAGQYGNSPIEGAMEQTLLEIGRRHGSPLVSAHPSPAESRLPVRKEAPPVSKAGGTKPSSEWKGRPDTDKGLLSEVSKVVNTLKPLLSITRGSMGWLDNLPTSLLPGWAGKAVRQIQRFGKLQTMGGDVIGLRQCWPENPSERNLPAIDTKTERVSQWVRASAPPLDHYRAVIRRQMRQTNLLGLGVPISNTAYFFTHWCNRYLLAESYRIRSGEYGSKLADKNFAGDARGVMEGRMRQLESRLAGLGDAAVAGEIRRRISRISEDLSGLERTLSGVPHMQMLVETTPDSKGKEPWRSDPDLLEEHFCILAGAAKSPGNGLYLPGLFNRKGSDIEAFAMAMLYNANEPAFPSDRSKQPNPGWDTLNWSGGPNVPEWSGIATDSASGSVVDILRFGRLEMPPGRAIRLNWQAKLVPISQRVLRGASASKEFGSGFRSGLEQSLRRFSLSCY